MWNNNAQIYREVFGKPLAPEPPSEGRDFLRRYVEDTESELYEYDELLAKVNAYRRQGPNRELLVLRLFHVWLTQGRRLGHPPPWLPRPDDPALPPAPEQILRRRHDSSSLDDGDAWQCKWPDGRISWEAYDVAKRCTKFRDFQRRRLLGDIGDLLRPLRQKGLPGRTLSNGAKGHPPDGRRSAEEPPRKRQKCSIRMVVNGKRVDVAVTDHQASMIKQAKLRIFNLCSKVFMPHHKQEKLSYDNFKKVSKDAVTEVLKSHFTDPTGKQKINWSQDEIDQIDHEMCEEIAEIVLKKKFGLDPWPTV